MGLLNQGWIFDSLLHNGDEKKPVKYRESHGATHIYLGGGLLFYTIPYLMKSKICVCLGSGGGYVPRMMTAAHWDLKELDVFLNDEYGTTYIVDAKNGVNGDVEWDDETYFTDTFEPKVIESLTDDAYYNFFLRNNIEIDYLHIDAGHSFEDVELDFELYSERLSERGIITIHDTDKKYYDSLIVPKGEKFDDMSGPGKFIEKLKKEDKWQIFDFFDFKEKTQLPFSTGTTIIQRKK
jgi:hypothetical protein|tara:strand:- start:71 stop:781 length:711 start_codon:yes stop_codon:yes gene_type:complete